MVQWLTCRCLQFIRRYNAWEIKRQAERLSEEARRKAMYDFPSSIFADRLQVSVSTRGWKPLAMIDET